MEQKINSADMLDDGQLAKALYLRNMSGMKEILNMGEFRIGNRESKEYKFFKKVVMDEFYNAMTDLFTKLEAKGVLIKCPCGTGIRQGYKPCSHCNGAGHCNAPEFNEWMLFDENEYPEDHGQPDPEPPQK
jgi:hypothetical protein